MKRKLLVFWLRSVQHCKHRKKERSQELFVFAVIKTGELRGWKCCKKGKDLEQSEGK